jgi:hypothetical protein
VLDFLDSLDAKLDDSRVCEALNRLIRLLISEVGLVNVPAEGLTLRGSVSIPGYAARTAFIPGYAVRLTLHIK